MVVVVASGYDPFVADVEARGAYIVREPLPPPEDVPRQVVGDPERQTCEAEMPPPNVLVAVEEAISDPMVITPVEVPETAVPLELYTASWPATPALTVPEPDPPPPVIHVLAIAKHPAVKLKPLAAVLVAAVLPVRLR